MPRGDGTGPMGMGRMTGRRAGFCAGFKIPGFINPMIGTSMGFGWRRKFRGVFWFLGLLSTGVYFGYRWFNRSK